MMARRDVVSFLSDYGHADEFVGVCKAVMLGIAPHVRIVDLGHDVAPHDVRAGSLMLVRAVQYLPRDGIVLAVVDPGVGTERRLVGVEVDGGVLLAPDNGLLGPAVAMLGGARHAVALTGRGYGLPAPGPTFAGRDLLAPAAGQLACGASLDDLGEPVDVASLVPGLVALPTEREGGALDGEVWWVDRFGNCQLNVGPEDLAARGAAPGGPVQVHLGSTVRMARWVGTYSEARPSELALVVDSYGLLTLAMDRRSAAAEHRLAAGSRVRLVAPGASVPDEELAAGGGGGPSA